MKHRPVMPSKQLSALVNQRGNFAEAAIPQCKRLRVIQRVPEDRKHYVEFAGNLRRDLMSGCPGID